MNLSAFQSQARAVTPDGKLTPEFLRLLSAIVRDLQAVTGDQSLDTFASAAGVDVSGEAIGVETVTQSSQSEDNSGDVVVMQPVKQPVAADELTGTTLASNVIYSTLKYSIQDIAGDALFTVKNQSASGSAAYGFGFEDVGTLRWTLMGYRDGTGECRMVNLSSGTAVTKWDSTKITVPDIRIDKAPTAAVVAQSHYVTLNLNGTDYKFLLGT